ncbi:MAG: aminotransferase class I/II-fold pyridoxal phosphate-dependent enzyme [Planctomycetota bacterium]|nr:MAG: aminotransferase class I/II-fold pyridoxal phosphate-dependent enzyme [Planctomycetota bacterium]REJ94031.1 MAG: aminotransferase class I/II-fold pyridoxal phosphate-dependent enzyme [Planctomycetota bacterium]REK17869.1 MAG: aminotransferase class I/II-fold pyridoxal phosphate-dependent enzyme [Planctomycetota bacterium]REK42410.1 MAG: aminotransferase class I/II-fold pyridoxal phosphate-dependent enzyme [Planctomycetota bacterium]
MRKLSPRRNSTEAEDALSLASEQLAHFGIEPTTPFGETLLRTTERLYESQADVEQLWQETLQSIHELPRGDRIAFFNAQKFLSFQLAKLLDTWQNPFRQSYQSLGYSNSTQTAKGPYPVFDNVTAIFSATPVIARTATYIYACAEWIGDAFLGKELLLEIYSRLLNPTSVSLANFVVDLEAGPYSSQYFAWNFNSGMAAIDGALSHILGRDDVLITSRNLYGGAHQLIHDWYAKPGNLEIAVETFDGYQAADFALCLERVKKTYADRFDAGRRAYVYIESPCNPHGYVLDVPGICELAHRNGLRVMLDATVGTPFLSRPLQHEDPDCRPDFVIHSYTKDLSGAGSTIAGVVIGRNEDMFVPKGEQSGGVLWSDTMFWNVYYVKGAFLGADGAYEVMQGMRTLEVRMLTKCINTEILARLFDAHPQITVHCNVLEDNANSELRQQQSFLGLPAPLFTIDMDAVPREAFQRFFDSLAPTFGHMISLGQSNTIVSCPAFTTHSELNEAAQLEGGIHPTTIRFAVGDEDPKDLVVHFIESARLAIDPFVPGFGDEFLSPESIDQLVEDCYVRAHWRYIQSKRSLAEIQAS